MPRPCSEPKCECGDFNGTAEAPFCQTCGHSQGQHNAARAAATCTRCDCTTFVGSAQSAFCVTCGHSRAEHAMTDEAVNNGSSRTDGGTISPILLAAIGGALILVVIFALLIALHAGPFASSAPTAEPASTQQATTETATTGLNRMAFSRGACTSGAACPVYWAAGDGTGERPTPSKGWVQNVSPDGTYAVVARSVGDKTVSEVVTFDPILVRRTDGSLSFWSPDSKWLIDTSDVSSPVFTLVNAQTLEPTTIALPSGETTDYPTIWWSPDSRRLLVETSQGNGSGRGLTLVDIQKGESTRIVPARRHYIDGASWSPDGQQFSYGVRDYAPAQDSGGDAPWTLRIQHLGSTTGADVAEGKAPVWGPKLIAFEHPEPPSYNPDGYVVDQHQIWTIDPSIGATSAKLLTHFHWGKHDDFEQGPSPEAWLPDGSGLVGRLPGMESARGFVVRLDTGKLQIFKSSSGDPYYSYSFIAVSADGKSVVASTGGWEGDTAEYTLFSTAGGPGKPYMPRAKTLAVSAAWNP